MLKPFDLDKALRGAKVVTRDGREVKKLFYVPEMSSKKRLIVVNQGDDIWTYSESGEIIPGAWSQQDLLLSVPEPREVKQTMWMNERHIPSLCSSEPAATLFASKSEAEENVMHPRNYSSIAEEVTVIRKVEE